MKNTLSLVAMAAGFSQVMATGFHNAPKFTCPGNTDNVCLPDFSGGLSWGDLPFGGFDSYKGFKWSGFQCADKFGKRDELSPRTNFQSKCITGTATPDKKSSPKISCDKSKGNNKMSIKTFQVTPKFDCDLEFHYTMPDGSACKHRSSCKASGTTVENSQCGGATDVTVVYPPQPNKPKSCDFGIHHIDFHCSGALPSKSLTSSYAVSTSSSVVSTSSASVATTSSIASYSASSASVSSVAETSSSSASVATTSSYVVDTTSSAVESTSSAVVSSASYILGNSSSTAAVSTTSSAAVSSVSVTSYMTTSTVFTTSVQTITSCAATVPNCPARSTVLSTVTLPVSTTICSVTETLAVSSPAESTPAVSATTVVASSSTTPAGPIETLPCPDVVPSCLNTWMFSVGCKDNTDSACYCPDANFTKNIFSCMYAHGESDEVISEAISYFQGICAPFVPSNPGIATGAETITTILTATPATYPAAVTTIEVATTVVVPCTNEAGETIPSSSSTVTISTSLTVPGVVFTTVTSGASSTGVVVVPGTYSATIPAATPTLATATSTPVGGAPLYPTVGASTTLFTAPAGTGAVGTGGVYPSAPASTTSIVTAGAAHVGAGLSLAGFAGMVVAALL
ncbi:hypothetical protein F4818DRAFT_428747 [Hypoxylon cercidicola]|nr:hypothetical protein F4818DRAFT_428747 [Hypoxylon cercidicola]